MAKINEVVAELIVKVTEDAKQSGAAQGVLNSLAASFKVFQDKADEAAAHYTSTASTIEYVSKEVQASIKGALELKDNPQYSKYKAQYESLIKIFENFEAQLKALESVSKTASAIINDNLNLLLNRASSGHKGTENALTQLQTQLAVVAQGPKGAGLLNWLEQVQAAITQTAKIAEFKKITPEIRANFGAEFTEALKKGIDLKAVFDEAFKGNTAVLEPLKKILGETGFLSAFSSYVNKTFKEVSINITDATTDAVKQLGNLSKRTETTAEGLNTLRAGFINSTGPITSAIKSYEGFAAVQSELQRLFENNKSALQAGTQSFSALSTTVKESEIALAAISAVLKNMNPAVGGVGEAQVASFKEFVAVAENATKKLAELVKEEKELSRLEGIGLSGKDEYKKTAQHLSTLTVELQAYQQQLSAYKPTNFDNVSAALVHQRTELEAVKKSLEGLKVPENIEPVVNNLVQGFGSAREKVETLEKTFTGFETITRDVVSKIDANLNRISGNFGQKLIDGIKKVEGEIQQRFTDLRIPPLKLSTLKIQESSNTYQMFPKLAALVTSLDEQWGAFAKHLQEMGKSQHEIDLLGGAIKKLAGPMDAVTKDWDKFGSLFNSTSSEAKGNLELLEYFLKNLATTVLGIGTAFAAPIQSVHQLKKELDLTATTKEELKGISLAVSELQSKILTAVPVVTQLTTSFKSFYDTAGKKVATDSNLEVFDKQVTALTTRIEGLLKTLDGISAAGKRADDTTVFGAQLGAQIDTARESLKRLQSDLVAQVKTPLEGIKTQYIDESLSATSKEFTKFESQSTKALTAVNAAFLSLSNQSGVVFTQIQSKFARMLAALADPSAMREVFINLEGVVRSYQTAIEKNAGAISVGNAKQATEELKVFITVLREYLVAQEAATRLKLNDPSLNSSQAAALQQQAEGYKNLVASLQNIDSSIDESNKKFLDNKTVLAASKDAITQVIDKYRALESTFIGLTTATSTFDLSKAIPAFNAMSNGSKVATDSLDKTIKKMEELIAAGHKIPADLIPPLKVGANTVTFTTLQEFIDHLRQVRQEIADKPTNVSGVVEPLQIVKKAFEDVIAVFNRVPGVAGQNVFNPADIKSESDAVTVLQTNLQHLNTEFQSVAASAKDFGSLQAGYNQHKEGLNQLDQAIKQVLGALQSLPASAKISFGGADIGVGTLTAELTKFGETVTQQMVAVREGLQAGGQSLDNFLLTGAQGSRFQVIDKQITDFIAVVKAAESQLTTLTSSTKPIQLADVEALKTSVTELVKARKDISDDIKNAMDRIRSGLQTTEAVLGPGAFGPLEAAAKAALLQFGDLITKLDGVQVATGGASVAVKDFVKSTEGILQFNETVAKMGTALSSVQQPATSLDKDIKLLSDDLKKAEQQIGITATSFDNLDKPVLQSYMTSLTTKVRELTGSFLEATRAIDLMERAKLQNTGAPVIDDAGINKAKTEAEALRKEIELLQHRMGVLKEIMAKQPAGTNILGQSGLDIATSVDKVKGAGALLSKFMSNIFDTIIKGNPAFRQMSAESETAANKVKLLVSAVREMEEKLVTSLRNMDMMAMGLQMLGQAMVEPFKKSLESYSKFSDTMAFIKGATGATAEEMKSLAEAAVVMGSTTRQSAQDAADGLKQLALAGYNASESIKILPTVLRLAQAAEMQLGPATEILVNITASQRIGIEGIASATDVLALAANKTTATFTDMGTAFKYIGALAGTIGNSFEDTAGAVALLHNSGLKGSMAGTALRGSLQALLNPTKDEARVMGELSKRLGGVGLQIQDSQGKFVGFRKIIEQFEQSGISTSEVLELFGQRAGPGMAALLQMGSKKLGELVDDLGNAEGATGRLAKNMEETFAGSVKIMGNSLEALGEIIGHAIAGPLGTLANAVTAVTQRLVDFGAQFPVITSVLSNLAGGVAVSLLAFGTLALTWTMMLVPAKQLLAFLKSIFTVLVFGASALKGITIANAATIAANLKLGQSLTQAVGATSKLNGAWIALKATAMIVGKTMFSLAGAFSPLGLALWGIVAVVGIVAFAFSTMKRNLSVINAEFEKNRQVIVSQVAEFRSLRDQITATANSILALRSKNASLSGADFINLKGFQQQKAKLMAQIQELRTRIKESKLGEAYNVQDQFDAITGESNGMVITIAKTGEAFAALNVDMLSTTEGTLAIIDNMKKINDALDSVGKAEIDKSLNEQLQENLSRSGILTSGFTDLLAAQEDYNRIKAALQKAEISGDKKTYDQLITERNKLFIRLRDVYKSNIGRISYKEFDEEGFAPAIKKQAEKLAIERRNLVAMVESYIRDQKGRGGVVNQDVVRKAVLKATKDSGKLSDEALRYLGPQIDEIFTAIQQRAELQAEKVDFGEASEKMFRGLQRQVSSGVKQLDEFIKQLTSRQEEIKRLLDVYEKNADTFAKVRDDFVSAGKSKLDTGISQTEQELNTSLSKIVGTAYKNYGAVAQASISWVDPASAATRKEADQFQVIQDIKVATAKSAADKMYNIFTNSAQKQIDDLERNSKVTEQVFRVPIRLEAEEKFNWLETGLVGGGVVDLTKDFKEFNDVLVASEKAGHSFTKIFTNIKPPESAIRRFVAGGEKATRELFEYEIMFNQKLLEERINLETSSLAAKQDAVNKEMALTQSFYAKVRPLYGEGTVKRIELEQEFQTKQKDLQQKGVENAKASLNALYAEHKKISDKIVKLKQDEAKMIERMDALRAKVNESGQNDIQKREQSFAKIANLMKIAQEAEGGGNFDKALKAYEKMASLAEGIQFEPFDSDTKQKIVEYSDLIEEGFQRNSAANEKAAQGQLSSLEESGKTIQEQIAKFEDGAKTAAENLTVLAQKMEELKASFAKEMNIDLQTEGAANKLVELEQQVLELRRIMETPMELVLNDDAFKKLREYQTESRELSKKKFAAQTDREGLEKIQQQISDTNELIAVTNNLSQAVTVYQRRLQTSDKVSVGAKVGDMKAEDVTAINKALKDREDTLTSLQRAYEAAGDTFPETMQAELESVIKSRVAFEEGKDASVVYTQEIAKAVETNGDLIKEFTNAHSAALSKSTTAVAVTLREQIPAMTELSKKMMEVASDENLNIQVRVSASTNLSQLYNSMKDLNKELTKTQTSDGLTMLTSQMEGYKKSLLATGNANDEVTKKQIASIDEDLKAIEKLKTATTLSNQEKIQEADKLAQKLTSMQKSQQAEQTAKIMASPADAAKAGAENAKIANDEAQKNPVVVPIAVNQEQAKSVGQAAAQTVQQSVTAQTPTATIAAKVDPGQVKQDVAQTVKTVSEAAPPVPIKVDSNTLQVTATEVEKLKDKLSSLVQANATSPLRFFGDKTEISRNAEAVRKELDSLLLRTDPFGKIKLDVNDTSLKTASGLLSEMESKAVNYSSTMITGANEIGAKLKAAKVEAEINPTVGNLAKVQEYEGQLERVRIALMTIKKVEETPSNLDVVPAGLQEKVTTLGSSFATLKTQIDAASTDHPELAKYGTDLESLQNKLTNLNEQLGQGLSVDPSKFEELKTKFLTLLDELKTKGPQIGVYVADTDTVKTELAEISSLLTNVPEYKVTSDHTQIDEALEVTNKLLGLDGKRTNIEIVANLVTNRQGGSTGFQTGGLVELISHFANGGLAQIQRFANGGRTMFKRIANMVPGVGSGDKVPAMLEPGEFVIRKSMVERYGTGFMDGINRGLIQFKALGGQVFDMPTQALSGMQQYVMPNYPIPETVAGGPSVDVRLHLGGKVFNMKSPRDQVKDLVSAVKQLDRGY